MPFTIWEGKVVVEVIKVHKLNKQQHRQLVQLVGSLDKMGYYVKGNERA